MITSLLKGQAEHVLIDFLVAKKQSSAFGKHLGFSYHYRPATITAILPPVPSESTFAIATVSLFTPV